MAPGPGRGRSNTQYGAPGGRTPHWHPSAVAAQAGQKRSEQVPPSPNEAKSGGKARVRPFNTT